MKTSTFWVGFFVQSIIMKFVRLAQPTLISTRKTGAHSTIFWLSVTNYLTNHTKFSGLKQQLFHFAKPYIIWILCGPFISVHCSITGTGWPGLGISSMMVHPHGGSLWWLPAGNYAGALSQGPLCLSQWTSPRDCSGFFI